MRRRTLEGLAVDADLDVEEPIYCRVGEHGGVLVVLLGRSGMTAQQFEESTRGITRVLREIADEGDLALEVRQALTTSHGGDA